MNPNEAIHNYQHFLTFNANGVLVGGGIAAEKQVEARLLSNDPSNISVFVDEAFFELVVAAPRNTYTLVNGEIVQPQQSLF